MVHDPHSMQPRRRTGRRATIVLFIVVALIAGWAWAWKYAAAQAQAAVDGWRVREAKAGRVYSCGAQSIGGFPFRIELGCQRASAQLRNEGTALEIKTPSVVVAAQIYEPETLVSQFIGPLTVAVAGHEPFLSANWTYGESRVTGTPRAPQSASLNFERPTVDRIADGKRENLLSAKHIEMSGRITSGSAADHPVIELALRAERASAPGLSRAAEPPIDANLTMVLRGLSDFSPKPWPVRFRQLQQAGGRIDITQARVKQGDTLAVGQGSLSIDDKGQLAGQINVTVAGLEPFLDAIGAAKAIQQSHNMDKVAGMLDRLSPGLGDVARQQAGANLGLGISMLGQPATLDGRRAVTLPLRFADGTAYLGPIPLGPTPALF
jgi:hypothetical protein